MFWSLIAPGRGQNAFLLLNDELIRFIILHNLCNVVGLPFYYVKRARGATEVHLPIQGLQ